MNSSLQKHGYFCTSLHIFLIAACYIFFLLPVLDTSSLLPEQDNLMYHLPNYTYFSNSYKYGYGFPLWYPSNGGAQTGIFSLSFFPFLPYRLLGYLFYLLLPFHIVTLYKMTLAAGMLITCAGWWLFLNRLTGSRAGATFGCLMVLLGGTGMTVLHQEQILATITWAPWVMLVMLRVGKTPAYIVLLAVFLGFSITTHYPHIQFIVFTTLLISLAMTGKITTAFIRSLVANKQVLLLALIAFILSASPLLYVTGIMGDFSSPHRETAELMISSYEDYIRLNRMGRSSAPVAYFANYVFPQAGLPLDQFALYVTAAGLAAAVAGIALCFRATLAPLIVLIVCAWASIGVNGYLPQLLYYMKVPSLPYFRQWYHFIPMLNLSLSVMGAIGFASLLRFLVSLMDTWRKRTGYFVVALLFTVSVGAMLFESRQHLKSYINLYNKKIYIAAEVNEKKFIDLLTRGWFEYYKLGPLLMYREWYTFVKACPYAAVRAPFVTTNFYADEEIPPTSLSSVMKRFCGTGASRYAIIVHPLSGAGGRLPGIRPLKKDTYLPSGLQFRLHRSLSAKDYSFTPRGAFALGSVDSTSLVVFPFSYKMGLRAYLNGGQAETYSVYGGAMTGVLVPGGEFRIELRVPFSLYQPAVLVQYLILAGIISLPLFSLLARNR
jgi:hypothetical protein